MSWNSLLNFFLNSIIILNVFFNHLKTCGVTKVYQAIQYAVINLLKLTFVYRIQSIFYISVYHPNNQIVIPNRIFSIIRYLCRSPRIHKIVKS
ncbi:hypothetical protein BDK61_1664 [Haloarcula quadrata]|uniref:Uncharacterized protein n=1 Tax=Haloarcula quadrata TaxID=182779 RepID=A0A495R560_9EURY|nr:hypothetical protein BDK61_1664 [Haloarcula quadrata]